MQRVYSARLLDRSFNDILSGVEAGDDPRAAMARVNREIVAYQKAGKEVPATLLRLSQALTSECIAQSQGR